MAIKKITQVEGFPEVTIKYHKCSENYGVYMGDTNTIYISETLCKDQQTVEETIFHELLHHVIYKSGWHFALGEQNVSEEGLVRCIENHIKHLIKLK